MWAKKLSCYSIENKAKVIEFIDEGFKNDEMVKHTGFPESTVRNFKRQKDEIKASLKVINKLFSGNLNILQHMLTN